MTTPIRRCFALCTLTSLSVICKFQRGSKWGVMKIMSANVDVQIRAARFVCLHVHIEMKLSEHHMTEWTHTLTHSCTIIRAYYRVKHTCCFSLFSTRWCYWWKPCNIHLHQIVADVKRIQFYEQLCLRGNALRASKHLQLPFQNFIIVWSAHRTTGNPPPTSYSTNRWLQLLEMSQIRLWVGFGARSQDRMFLSQGALISL